MSDRAVAQALTRPAHAPTGAESQFLVRLSESEVSSQSPERAVETVRWEELERAVIHTTSDGPFAPDCFWLLIGSGTTGCCIPQGATGDAELLARLQQLPGFDNKAFIDSQSSTEEAFFLCWQLQQQEGG